MIARPEDQQPVTRGVFVREFRRLDDKFDLLDDQFNRLAAKFIQLDARMDRMEQNFDGLMTRADGQKIVEMLDSVLHQIELFRQTTQIMNARVNDHETRIIRLEGRPQ